MTFFFLPKRHFLTVETLPDGPFFTKKQLEENYEYQVPFYCVPVWCPYTGNFVDEHTWENQISLHIHEKHPLGFTISSDNSFFDGFYEITYIEGLTFENEGDAWNPDTNEKIRVEKTDQMSVWNPFFQRYDPPCDCLSGKVKKHMTSSSDCGRYMYFNVFIQCPILFFDVYCNCGMRDNREHATDSDSD